MNKFSFKRILNMNHKFFYFLLFLLISYAWYSHLRFIDLQTAIGGYSPTEWTYKLFHLKQFAQDFLWRL